MSHSLIKHNCMSVPAFLGVETQLSFAVVLCLGFPGCWSPGGPTQTDTSKTLSTSYIYVIQKHLGHPSLPWKWLWFCISVEEPNEQFLYIWLWRVFGAMFSSALADVCCCLCTCMLVPLGSLYICWGWRLCTQLVAGVIWSTFAFILQ